MTILEIGLKFIGWLLDKTQADTLVKQKFYSFIEAMADDSKVSVKLKNSYERQLAKAIENEKANKGISN